MCVLMMTLFSIIFDLNDLQTCLCDTEIVLLLSLHVHCYLYLGKGLPSLTHGC
jgi:hypothetical protein